MYTCIFRDKDADTDIDIDVHANSLAHHCSKQLNELHLRFGVAGEVGHAPVQRSPGSRGSRYQCACKSCLVNIHDCVYTYIQLHIQISYRYVSSSACGFVGSENKDGEPWQLGVC